MEGAAVVTGATGHVGNVLVRALLNAGAPVRAVLLPGENDTPLEGLEVERVEADVRDLDALCAAFAGASVVYHLAGVISILPRPTESLYTVNVVGTRNVLRACEECHVRRLVYVSSVHALVEPPHGTPVTEAMGCNPDDIVGPYARSKAQATQEVLEAVAQGLDAVIVFPSGVVGPYDFNVSEMGHVILDFVHRRLPAYVEGAYDFVDVRDVVGGILAAAQQGRTGEGYILSGESLTVSGMMAMLQDLSGVPAPRLKIPFSVARAAAVFTPFLANVRRKKPRFTSYSLRVLRSNGLMDCSKACKDLAFDRRPLSASFADALDWFQNAGMWSGK